MLSLVALTSATLAGYLFSVLQHGHWNYPELLPWMGLAASGVVASLVALAAVYCRGVAAISRLSALLILLCSTSAAGIFYGVLANCRLSCRNKIISQVPNRNGTFKAVWFYRRCIATATYCPSVSYVSILRRDERLPNAGSDTFGIDGYADLRLEWILDDRLVIWYPAARLLRHQATVDGVHVEYRPVGGM